MTEEFQMPIDDAAFPHLDRYSGFSKREDATLMLLQGMLAKTGVPSDAGRFTMVEAAAQMAGEVF